MSNKPAAPSKEEVQAFHARLLPGRANAKTAAQLLEEMGMEVTENTKRYPRLLSEHALRYGILICSGQAGYWLAADLEDIAEPVAIAESNGASYYRKAALIKALAQKKLYQTQLL